MKLLEQKIAIITGASSGIGLAASKLFASHGAKLILVSRTLDKLERVCDEIAEEGGAALACAGDVGDAETHAKAIDVALSEFGGLDIAFNNAGTLGPIAPMADITRGQWSEVISANLTAAFLGAGAQIPAMLERKGAA